VGSVHDGVYVLPLISHGRARPEIRVHEIGALVVISFISVMDFQVSEGHLIFIIPMNRFDSSMYALSPLRPRLDGDEWRV
jgi:hypothetical protein